MTILKAVGIAVAVAMLGSTAAYADSHGDKLEIIIKVDSFAKAEKGEQHKKKHRMENEGLQVQGYPGGSDPTEKSIATGSTFAKIEAHGDTGFDTGGGYSASASTGGTSDHQQGGAPTLKGEGGGGWGGDKDSTSASASGGFHASGCTGAGC